MPRPALAFAGFVAVGLVAVLATLVGRSSLVYVAGPPPQTRVADLRAGQEICQGPVDLPDDAHFDRVRLHVAGPADTLAVTVRDDRGRVLGRGRTPRVSGAATDVTAPVGDIASTRPLRICVSGRGALYG